MMATIISASFLCSLALASGQVVTHVNRLQPVNRVEGHYLGGFAYMPLSSFLINAYNPAQTYVAGEARLSSTAVLGSSNTVTNNVPVGVHVASRSVQVAPVAVARMHAVSTPLVHVNTVEAEPQHVELVQSEPTAVVEPVAHAVVQPVTVTHQPVVTQVRRVVTQVQPVVSQVQPVVTQVQRVVHQVQPVVHEVRPVVHEVRPVVTQHVQPVAVVQQVEQVVDRIKLIDHDEPPHFEHVTVKDPKVTVVDLQRPGHPAMRLYQVVRPQTGPTTVEFVKSAPHETQVTVFDENNEAHHSMTSSHASPVVGLRIKRDKTSNFKTTPGQRHLLKVERLSSSSA